MQTTKKLALTMETVVSMNQKTPAGTQTTIAIRNDDGNPPQTTLFPGLLPGSTSLR